MHRSGFSLAALLVIRAAIAFAEPCGSLRDARDRSAIDYAPLEGFVDVCSRDFQLCVALTQGYPPTVKTIGYFVRAEEWERYQEGDRSGFSRYLIGQRASTMSESEFDDFRRYLHAQHGSMPEHTKTPTTFNLHERASLGIIDETPDSISFGAVLRLTPNRDGPVAPVWLGSINIVLQLKGETLTLYAFDTLNTPDETDGLKNLARQWLNCIRTRNAK